MPKITHVKRAQPRFETKPVLDPEGRPVKIPLTNSDGSPKMTRAKGGRPARPMFITKTVRDLENPKPLPRCDYPGCPDPQIKAGQAYKHMKVKLTYGGRVYNRHEEHPNWQVWEYRSSTSSMVARVQHDHDPSDADWESVEDAEGARDEAKADAEALFEEKSENLQNLPDALQETGDLYEQVQALESWVEGFDDVDFGEYPEGGDCTECDGTGKVDNPEYDAEKAEGGENEEDGYDEEEEIDCEHCDGTGETDEPSEDAVEEWRENARSALQEALDACEV